MNAPQRNVRDLAAYWMPFTPNRQFKAAPRMVASAKGMFYYTEDGREVLDGTAGLWCVNAGHGRPEVAEAVQRQLTTLDYAPSFNVGHPLAFDFANRLIGITPEGLDRVFFTNSGSESVDTALKIAIAYHRARGQGQRTRLVGRERGYHGVGFGGISVGGLVNNRKTFPLLPADHLPHTQDLERNAFSRGQPMHGAELADHLERIVALQGADTLAAVIVEPVAGSAGVLPPPAGYLPRLRQLCDKHGILLIFDEVITGYGRLGAPFAAQVFGVTPDLMTTAKGLTNGVLPMGAVYAKSEIYDAMMVGPEATMELFHGYTYSGHPVACAAGMAVLDIYEREGLLTRVSSIAKAWEDAVHSLRDCAHVIDIRNMGLTGAIELQSRPGKVGERGYEALVGAFAKGLMIRTSGDNIALSPPLIAEQAHFDRLVETLRDVLNGID
jgi:beta-alanine--pyruvate transaminase